MFSKSLRHPDDRFKSAGQWESLSERLFDELLTARHASDPPAPAELWHEWSKWDDFTPEGGPNIVGKDTVRDWLRAYEVSLSPEHGETSPYVRGVASLLLKGTKAGQVPIVVAQDGRTARVLMLEVICTRKLIRSKASIQR